jgi:TetR/AcrR family transcriptional repressor of nem operon
MARRKSFDETQVLDAAIDCFRQKGLNAASIRDLAGEMGIAGPSLYNAFGCKRTLFFQALARYVECGMRSRFAELEAAGPKAAVLALFDDFLAKFRSAPREGCLLVNSAIEAPAGDAELGGRLALYLDEIRSFLHRNLAAARERGEISAGLDPQEAAELLLAVLLGLSVFARLGPDEAQLRAMLRPALSLLDTPSTPIP